MTEPPALQLSSVSHRGLPINNALSLVLLGALHPAVHPRHTSALGDGALRKSRTSAHGPVDGFKASGQGVHFVLLDVAGELHQLALELSEWHFAFAGTSVDFVDRGVADDLGDALALLSQQGLDAVGITLGDQDDTAQSNDTVNGVKLGGYFHVGGGAPDHTWAGAQVFYRPRSSARLSFRLCVDIAFHAACKYPQCCEDAEHDADDQHEPFAAPQQSDKKERQGNPNDRCEHDGKQRLVLFALHVERLPELAVLLFPLGAFRGPCFLFRVRHDYNNRARGPMVPLRVL